MAEGYVYEPDRRLPPAWLVDVDGTLALMGDRHPFDYSRVLEDRVHEPVAVIVSALDEDAAGYHIVVLSGREDACRHDTEEWLDLHGIPYEELHMRATGDHRPDDVVKLEIFRERIAPRYEVLGVLDDRDKVVAMWRSIGLVCLQVAPGDF